MIRYATRVAQIKQHNYYCNLGKFRASIYSKIDFLDCEELSNHDIICQYIKRYVITHHIQ